MANAAPAYRSPRRSPQRSNRTRAQVRVVRGHSSQAGLSWGVILLVRIFFVVVVLFALVACVRIGLTSATVKTALAAEGLTGQVRNMQSYGSNLEVKQSSLSSPSHVRTVAAQQLGMSAPEVTDVIVLDEEVVAYNAQGDLSLSLTLSNLAEG